MSLRARTPIRRRIILRAMHDSLGLLLGLGYERVGDSFFLGYCKLDEVSGRD